VRLRLARLGSARMARKCWARATLLSSRITPSIWQVRPGKPAVGLPDCLTVCCPLGNELRYYFTVNSRYVLNKLKLLIFPFALKGHWSRSHEQVAGGAKFKPPVNDINAPDLYIPMLAFCTYCLVCSMADIASTPSRFKPEVRHQVSSLSSCAHLPARTAARPLCMVGHRRVGRRDVAPVGWLEVTDVIARSAACAFAGPGVVRWLHVCKRLGAVCGRPVFAPRVLRASLLWWNMHSCLPCENHEAHPIF